MKEIVQREGDAAKIAIINSFEKTLIFFRSQVINFASKNTGVNKSVFKSRAFISQSENYLWLGVNDLYAHKFGRPVKNSTGVSVGKKSFDGAFLMNKKLVFKRLGKKRLPIKIVESEIKSDVILAMNAAKPLALNFFKKSLKENLKIEKSKRGN